MNIANITDVTNGYSMQSTRSNNLMTQAIKDYEDEYYTGLTDEEREAIDKQVRAYLSKIKPGCKVNMDELKSLIQRLLDEYGYKGNMDEMVDSIARINTASWQNEKQTQSTSSDATVAYAKNNTTYLKLQESTQESKHTSTDYEMRSMASTNNSLKTLESEDTPHTEDTTSQIVENPDGTKSILILRNDMIVSKVTIGHSGDLEDYETFNTLNPKKLTQPTTTIDTH